MTEALPSETVVKVKCITMKHNIHELRVCRNTQMKRQSWAFIEKLRDMKDHGITWLEESGQALKKGKPSAGACIKKGIKQLKGL